MKLSELSTLTGKRFQISYRAQPRGDLAPFHGSLEGVEVADGCFLRGVYGEGTNELEVMRDYVDQISGKTLVVDAFKPTRWEIPTGKISV